MSLSGSATEELQEQLAELLTGCAPSSTQLLSLCSQALWKLNGKKRLNDKDLNAFTSKQVFVFYFSVIFFKN